MYTYDVSVTETKKGHRIWLQALESKSNKWASGTRFNVTYGPNIIWLIRAHDGKRTVTASKGGIVDLEGKKVTQWAMGATMAHVTISDAAITITRAPRAMGVHCENH